MNQLVIPSGSLPVVATELRRQLATISTPEDALNVRANAERAQKAFQLVGRSVVECNELAEIYLASHWQFGKLVDVPVNREGRIDTPLPGTHDQRTYARKFAKAIELSRIPEYVHEATEQLKQASITGCFEWISPGRHGNLKGEYEWYTPREIVDGAREVMGGIDLDPASCELANETVRASEIFTEDNDGLAREWHGRVFLNPPFAHPMVKFFAEKLLASLDAEQVTQAVWLSNACVDVGWWQELATRGTVCFHRGRVRFYGADGKLQPPTLGQTIVYLGDKHREFKKAFARFGVVLS